MFVELIIFLVTFVVAFFIYTHKKIHWHFDKFGLKYVPGVPMFGNVARSTFLKGHMVDDINAVYKAFPEQKYVGYIEGTVPIIMIRDPEIIKQTTVKDFDSLVDHRQFFGEDVDPLFGASMFMMKGNKWRDMRMTLSPAFTGSKMRLMFPLMTAISKEIINYLKDHVDEDLNVDEIMRRYANDVIASAGFGLQINSLVDKDNQFYTIGQSLFNFTFWQRIKMFFVAVCPALVKALGLTIFPTTTIQFFRNIVKSTMEYREKNNVERADMIQLLMEASKGKLKHNPNAEEKEGSVGFATVEEFLQPQGKVREWSDDELMAQVFLFFAAGFESTASVLVVAIHELAIRQEIQQKLYQEVKDFSDSKRDFYEHVQELKYLDCVLNETLRKWSPAIVLDRVCVRPYELPPLVEGGKPYTLKPGDIIYNVVNSIQMDKQYFPDPEKFDPDRFSDENKHNIKPFTFMPFGLGPRNCIGSRFALLELKVLLYSLVLNFKILKCAKTTDPLKLTPKDFNIKIDGGSWVKLETRA